jgi:hypothetical protein
MTVKNFCSASEHIPENQVINSDVANHLRNRTSGKIDSFSFGEPRRRSALSGDCPANC